MLGDRIVRSLKFGGIEPPGFKSSSLRSRIMPTPIPEQLVLPLQQHQGEAAAACVEVGERVLKYQLVAKGEQGKSLNLHAPTSGRITATDLEFDYFGEKQVQRTITLEPDGKDEARESIENNETENLDQPEMVARIEAAGICGMGGAGFPSAEKLKACSHQETDFLLINAAECEPYISCDEALLRERAELVVKGAEFLAIACKAKQTLVVIEADKEDAVTALIESLRGSEVSLKLVAPSYPAGEERQLLYGATGIELARAQHPPDVNCLVFNAGTAAACYAAIAEGKPCISRIVTLTGTPLRTPKNFEVLIGTPISHLLALCGIDQHAHVDTIVGGSLMGKYLPATSLPVCKTTNCVITTSVTNFPDPEPELACIRCGYCATACPTHLLPQQLLQFAKARELELAEQYGLADCIECGACAYVCPSKIPLVQYYRAAKEEIMIDAQARQHNEHRRQRFQLWQYRQKKQREAKKATRTAHTTGAETVEQTTKETFSRTQAREEIAAAVARVRKKRSGETD